MGPEAIEARKAKATAIVQCPGTAVASHDGGDENEARNDTEIKEMTVEEKWLAKKEKCLRILKEIREDQA